MGYSDHRTEQILVAILDILVAQNVAGGAGNIFINRKIATDSNELPMVTINQCSEELENLLPVYNDVALDVFIDVAAKGKQSTLIPGGDPEFVTSALNDLREEVSKALFLDERLGLGETFVKDFDELGSDVPEISEEGDPSTGSIRMNFEVKYRRLRKDPAAAL